MTRYPCRVVHPQSKLTVGGGPCANFATYFAKGNEAQYGHICRQCWRELSTEEKARYEEDAQP